MRPLCWIALFSVACSDPGEAPPGPVTPVDTDVVATDTPDTVAPPDGVDPPELPHPGWFALRRLTRTEYDHTVRDLFGTALRPGASFPADPRTAGFDNVADGLVVSPLWFDLADRAAAELAAEATRPLLAAPATITLEGESGGFVATGGAANQPEGAELAMHLTGTATAPLQLPAAGTWHLTATLRATPGPYDPLQYTIGVDGVVLAVRQIPSEELGVVLSELDVVLGAGDHTLTLTFDNDATNPAGDDRNLYIDRVQVAGPAEWTPDPEPHRRTMVCDPEVGGRACAEAVLAAFLPRAWRRPVDPAEIATLLGLYDNALSLGETPTGAVETVIHAALVHPSFLMLVEDAATPGAAAEPVDAWQLASRLSYFLWGSMPDDALFAAAAAGRLSEPAGIEAEVRRMVADPKADALVQAFAGQWLGVDALDASQPAAERVQAWTEPVRDAMRTEMLSFFRTFLATGRPLRELLTADEAWIDPTLADFLDLPVTGPWYDGAPFDRGGWLAQAGLLVGLSHPDRTSPVKRGAWVLGALLCAPPAAPPPGVPPLSDAAIVPANLRDEMAQHRVNPMCASCHDTIDPLGLAMEDFDHFGRQRRRFGPPADSTGALPSGQVVDGVQELQDALAADPAFFRCAVTHAYTWAHHRAPTDEDEAWVDQITGRAESAGASLDDILVGIATSGPFRTREAQP